MVVTRFLESCQQLVINKQSHLSSWHPVLGWISQGGGIGAAQARKQLAKLWSGHLLRRLLANPLIRMLDSSPAPSNPNTSSTGSSTNFIRRAIEARTNRLLFLLFLIMFVKF